MVVRLPDRHVVQEAQVEGAQESWRHLGLVAVMHCNEVRYPLYKFIQVHLWTPLLLLVLLILGCDLPEQVSPVGQRHTAKLYQQSQSSKLLWSSWLSVAARMGIFRAGEYRSCTLLLALGSHSGSERGSLLREVPPTFRSQANSSQ